MSGSYLPIDRKEQVPLGGLPQTIHVWGTRKCNPILLILHGGPGVPNRHGIAAKHMDLTGDFTVVAWDQRGTGAATSIGIRQTALVAMIFVALSVVIYWFYDDKKIVQTIREHTD